MMRKWARNAVFFGLGLASLTREKAQEWAQELVQRGEVSGQETQDVVDRMMEQAAEQRQRLSEIVQAELSQWAERLDLVKHSQLEERNRELTRRIERLEARVAELKGEAAEAEKPPDRAG